MEQTRIGRYQVLEEIASGGQATVYRAWDTTTGQVVALKVMHPHLTGDTAYLERFRREAHLAASIQHPNVIRIFEVGSDGNSHFISMEYLSLSIYNLIEAQGQLPIDRAVDICYQTALALEAAQQRNIVHRDIKPHNILLAPDGTAKVSDFGIARGAELATMTRTGALMGTPHYMSPEQAQGQGVDIRSDIYSLGVVLYQMLTGEVPFDADTPWEVIRQHIESRPKGVKRVRSDVPAALERIVDRCLDKNPARRYQTPQELAQALDQAVPEGLRSRIQPEFTPPNQQSEVPHSPPPAPPDRPQAVSKQPSRLNELIRKTSGGILLLWGLSSLFIGQHNISEGQNLSGNFLLAAGIVIFVGSVITLRRRGIALGPLRRGSLTSLLVVAGLILFLTGGSQQTKEAQLEVIEAVVEKAFEIIKDAPVEAAVEKAAQILTPEDSVVGLESAATPTYTATAPINFVETTKPNGLRAFLLSSNGGTQLLSHVNTGTGAGALLEVPVIIAPDSDTLHDILDNWGPSSLIFSGTGFSASLSREHKGQLVLQLEGPKGTQLYYRTAFKKDGRSAEGSTFGSLGQALDGIGHVTTVTIPCCWADRNEELRFDKENVLEFSIVFGAVASTSTNIRLYYGGGTPLTTSYFQLMSDLPMPTPTATRTPLPAPTPTVTATSVVAIPNPAPSGSISGRITDADTGLSVRGVRVTAKRVDRNSQSEYNTDADGRYTLQALPSGSYVITVKEYRQGYILMRYDGKLNWDYADLVTIDGTEDIEGIDFRLKLGGTISGRITDADTGLPIANFEMEATLGGDLSWGKTNSNGNYILKGIPDGVMEVYWHPQGYGYVEQRRMIRSSEAGAVEGVDFSLKRSDTISDTAADRVTSRPLATPTPALTPTPASLKVTKTDDTKDGRCDADCSLREAIIAASAGDSIHIPSGTYTLSNGRLVIDKDLALTGAGAEVTIIQAAETMGEATYGVFDIQRRRNVTLSGMTIRHGNTAFGGGISNDGTLALIDSIVSVNTADNGGGIYNVGTLTLANTIVSEGRAKEYGGGIYNDRDGILALNHSVISDNEAVRRYGGGIYTKGALTITDSTISGNRAHYGGGINGSTITMTNSTISGNSARSQGGGINGGQLTLTNSTISGNTAGEGGGGIAGDGTFTNTTVSGNTAGDNGGGILNRDGGWLTLINSTVTGNKSNKDGGGIYNEGVVEFISSVIAGNSMIRKGPDCYGDVTSRGHNLVGDDSDCVFAAAKSDLVGASDNPIDPKLGHLRDNGGPTMTHALLLGSPAIDAGEDSAAPATDQRGVNRPQGASSDIGAFEIESVLTQAP